MKNEYIPLSPRGFAATFICGVFVGTVVHAPTNMSVVWSLALAALLALHVRHDAWHPIPNGTYRRTRFLAWRKEADETQTFEPVRRESRRVH